MLNSRSKNKIVFTPHWLCKWLSEGQTRSKRSFTPKNINQVNKNTRFVYIPTYLLNEAKWTDNFYMHFTKGFRGSKTLDLCCRGSRRVRDKSWWNNWMTVEANLLRAAAELPTCLASAHPSTQLTRRLPHTKSYCARGKRKLLLLLFTM